MKRTKRFLLVLFAIVVCVGCDQVTKAMAKSYLPKTKALSFAGDVLRLDYNENKGAVFSFEYLLPERWRGATSTVAVTTLFGLIILCLMTVRGIEPLSAVGLSILCGGVLSNLLDRVVFRGYVIDFLNFGWGACRSSIFNVADAAIAIGLSLFASGIMWKVCSLAIRTASRKHR